MTDSLKQAAENVLTDLGDDSAAHSLDANVEQAVFEVRVGRSHETVSLRLHEGRLRSACTCGDAACAHLRVALRFVAGRSAPASMTVSMPTSTTITNLLVSARSQHALRPPAAQATPVDLGAPTRSARPRPSLHPDPRRVEHAERAHSPNSTSLAEVLEDMVTAVTRAGVSAESGLSVQETVARLLELAPTPLPLGISRFIGRMRNALDAHDVGLAAQVLHAAGALAHDLRAQTETADARRRRIAWLGALAGDDAAIERISDCTLLEVAREWVHGHERSNIERRYLVDLTAGEVYCEERLRRAHAASIGPCPRVVGVGLAETELGGLPRRIRLLQYTISANIDRETWQQFSFWCQRDFGALASSYRAAVEHFAGFCEPFAIVAPAAIVRDTRLTLLDEEQRALPLHGDDDAGTLRRFEELTDKQAPAWVAGRLLDRDGRLMLRPLALGILVGERMHHERL